MSMLKKKVKSSSGAAILIALLFFLLCAAAGSIILASATASAGRITGLVSQEQAYYTISSAAELLRDEIKGQEFSYYEESDERPAGNPQYAYLTHPNGALSDLLESASESIFKSVVSNPTYTKDISLSPKSETLSQTISRVSCQFTMDSNYNIKIDLSIPEGEQKDLYPCTLTIPAVLSGGNRAETTHTYQTTETVNGKEIEVTHEYERYTTTLVWGQGEIAKWTD